MSKKRVNTKRVVIDSNIFIKSFLNEEDSREAVSLLINYTENNISILVPSLFLYEVTSVLTSKGVDLELIKKTIKDQQNTNLVIVDYDFAISKKAVEISSKGNNKSGYPSFYDAIYHALAIMQNCDFVTADNKHYQKTKESGNIKLLSNLNS